MRRGPSRRLLVVLIAVVLVCAVAGWTRWGGGGVSTVVADFDQAVNVHEGDEVRILGVPVGTVTEVEPAADGVRVTMSYDDEYTLAENATAAIVTPTLVSVRYVQLGPLADGGERLADGATIPRHRTASPVEWDEVKTELNDLSVALGPDGANENGSLTRLLDASAANLEGRGGDLQQTLADLAAAAETLAGGREDLFGTVRNLQVFTAALRASDLQVRTFNHRLADVSAVLRANRTDLATTLRTIDRSARIVTDFVKRNRKRIAGTVGDISEITDNLARSRQALADLLQRVPTAVANLHNIYDPFSGAVTTSLAADNFNDPGQFICDVALLGAPGGASSPDAIRLCQEALGPLLGLLQTPGVPSPILSLGGGRQ